MQVEQIKEFINAIYTFPNKLLYNIFKPVDDLLTYELSSENLEKHGIVDYSEIDKAISTIKTISQTVLLNIYDMTARYATSDATIIALDNFDYQKNWNYLLQNAMFYDHLGKTEIMGEKLVQLHKNSNNKTIQNLTTRVYHKHILFNDIRYVGKVQQQISFFFPSINKPSKYIGNKSQIMKKVRRKIKK